jgi:hypothetical protein
MFPARHQRTTMRREWRRLSGFLSLPPKPPRESGGGVAPSARFHTLSPETGPRPRLDEIGQ